VTETDSDRRVRFWPLVGMACAAALLFALGYAVVTPGFSFRTLSDGLFWSAVLLGLGSVIPFLMDTGRGLSLGGRMGPDREQRNEIWQEEHRKRERGMRITFALALAALLAFLASLVSGAR
jgi:hypothetical protein